MDWIDALILGIVQGLSEYLPISSSGHLEIFRQMLGLDLAGADALEFDIILHAATVLSTLVILWREFVPLCVSFFTWRRDENFYYVLKLLVSCIPIAIVGFCLKGFVDSLFSGNLTIVGICLLATAFLLFFAYYFRTRHETGQARPLYRPHGITWVDAIVMGLAQAVAVLPGLSRSGTTIATGISLGGRREKVAHFSFFMVIIPILGEMLLSLKDLVKGEEGVGMAVGALPLIVGFLSAFIVGCAACKWMLEIVKRGKLVWFAYYCVAIGIVCLLWNNI